LADPAAIYCRIGSLIFCWWSAAQRRPLARLAPLRTAGRV